ncbi:hypothetical protein K2O51_31740 (plasmid) [Cupriavidus pinatubonensis]|uniref:hypothetical protein n=1 Tax=Cupriavidus pinatubonensis TaxID=248026 RepID=UPI001C73747F|nr:hypothetical protein [Cupriavidus pinatubonensis]QYY33599.1 hypothetical protein K2O51_31740 [Cupriavidus pinatubonensis]
MSKHDNNTAPRPIVGDSPVTARNYAAQAQKSLRSYAELIERKGMRNDAAMLQNLTKRVGEAVHFAVPDNAAILETGFRGLEDGPLRLPYPEITVEYFVPYNADLIGDRLHAPKRLIYACEITPGRLPAWLPTLHHEMIDSTLAKWAREMPELGSGRHGILVWAASLVQPREDMEPIWCPEPAFWLMPERYPEYDVHSEAVRKEAYQRPSDPTVPFTGGRRPIVVGGMVPALVEMFNTAMSRRPGQEDQVLEDFQRDISLEAGAILEFIEACSCSNIQASTLTKGVAPDSSLAKRRAADGKVPMFETKVLTLDVPGRAVSGTGGGNGGGGRASPRMHMRRGHIRRLEDGRRIWVNNAVIGVQSNGQIHKSYAIESPQSSHPRPRG